MDYNKTGEQQYADLSSNTISMTMASEIRRRRKLLKYTLNEFGAIFNVSSVSVSNWESGKYTPSLDYLEMMCRKTLTLSLDASETKRAKELSKIDRGRSNISNVFTVEMFDCTMDELIKGKESSQDKEIEFSKAINTYLSINSDIGDIFKDMYLNYLSKTVKNTLEVSYTDSELKGVFLNCVARHPKVIEAAIDAGKIDMLNENATNFKECLSYVEKLNEKFPGRSARKLYNLLEKLSEVSSSLNENTVKTTFLIESLDIYTNMSYESYKRYNESLHNLFHAVALYEKNDYYSKNTASSLLAELNSLLGNLDLD